MDEGHPIQHSEDRDSSIKQQFNELLSEIRSQRQEVQLLKEEIHGNSLNLKSEVKKNKTESDLDWRFKGNKLQYDFNNEVSETIKQALWGLEHNKDDYCKELLNELPEKLRKRNKLIRIADTSIGGWDTVKLYESNPLASDSEDESRINRAESRALKRKKTQTSHSGKRRTSYHVSSDHYMVNDRRPTTFGPSTSAQPADDRGNRFRSSTGPT